MAELPEEQDLAKARKNSAEAFVSLERFLRRLRWKPTKIPKLMAWQVNFDDEGPIAACAAHILPDTERFVFFVQVDVRVPMKRRVEVADLLNRLNYGTIIGNFEMDAEDGEVRYRASLDFRDTELTENLIANVVSSAMDATEDYVQAVLAVSEGELTAKDAFRKIAS